MSQIYADTGANEIYSDPNTVLNELKPKEDPKSVVWWKPKEDVIVAGSKRVDGIEQPGDNIIINLKTKYEAKKQYKAGRISWDDYIVAGVSQEWESDAYEFKSAIDKSKKRGEDLLTAAVIRPEHFAALQTSEINELIIGIENEEHILLQTVNNINMDRLNERVILEVKDDQTKLVTRNVGEEGLPTEIGPYQWRTKQLGLQLNGIKAVFAGTMRLTAFDIDVMSPFIQIMQGALLNDKQRMIAEILNDGTGFTSGAISVDWDTFAANGRPDALAYKDLQTYIRAITLERKGQPQYVASALGVYEAYLDNSRAWGQEFVPTSNTNSATIPTNFIDRNPPRLPGRAWAVDDLLDEDTAWVYNSKAIYFAQGPRRSSALSNSITGNFGTVNLEYYKAHLMFPELIKKYTAVLT